jgi:hypothetical protein
VCWLSTAAIFPPIVDPAQLGLPARHEPERRGIRAGVDSAPPVGRLPSLDPSDQCRPGILLGFRSHRRGPVVADGVSFRQCESEADGLWCKPESPKRMVRCLVERPRAHLDLADSAASHLGKGGLNQRPSDASSPPLVVHRDLVDLAPSPRGAEGILLALMKQSQHVTYGHAIFLGDPDQYRRFLEERPKPRRHVFNSRRPEVFRAVCDMQLMDESVQNSE